MSCDCYLGYLYAYHRDKQLHMSDIKRLIGEDADYMIRHNSYGLLVTKEEAIKKLLDGRSGHSYKFNYCPTCGSKINWKKIKKDLLS